MPQPKFFDDYIEGDIPEPPFFTGNESILDIKRKLGVIYRNANELKQRLNEVANAFEQVTGKKSAEKMAHLMAINAITPQALDLFKTAALQAMFDTFEYNHELFVSRTISTIDEFKDQIIYIKAKTPGIVSVTIDISKLGDLDEYAEAVMAVRDQLIVQTTNPDARSMFWAEKVFGVDRLGVKIRTSPKGAGDEGEDLTYRYLGSWRATMEARLALTSGAPWLEIVDKGNLNIKLLSDIGGEPYPAFPPTRFTSVVAKKIEAAFKYYYEKALVEAQAYLDSLSDIPLTKKAETLLKYLRKKSLQQLYGRAKVGKVNKTLWAIKADGKTWDLYLTRRGRIGVRYSLSNLK